VTGQGCLKLVHAVEESPGNSAAYKHITTVRCEKVHALSGIEKEVLFTRVKLVQEALKAKGIIYIRQIRGIVIHVHKGLQLVVEMTGIAMLWIFATTAIKKGILGNL